MSKESKDVCVVWFRQGNKKIVANFFDSFDFAEKYVNAFHHFKLNGYFFIEKMTISDLAKLL